MIKDKRDGRNHRHDKAPASFRRARTRWYKVLANRAVSRAVRDLRAGVEDVDVIVAPRKQDAAWLWF